MLQNAFSKGPLWLCSDCSRTCVSSASAMPVSLFWLFLNVADSIFLKKETMRKLATTGESLGSHGFKKWLGISHWVSCRVQYKCSSKTLSKNLWVPRFQERKDVLQQISTLKIRFCTKKLTHLSAHPLKNKDPQVFIAEHYSDHLMYAILFFLLFNGQIIQWDWIFQPFACPDMKHLAELTSRAWIHAEAVCLPRWGKWRGLKPVLRWHTSTCEHICVYQWEAREKLSSWDHDTLSISSTHCWVMLWYFFHSLSAQATISSEESSFLTGHKSSTPKDCWQPFQTSLENTQTDVR